MSEFGKAMLKGTAWSTIAYTAARALNLVALVVLARLLLPADFGVVAAVSAYLMLIELASDLGMNATVIYEQEHGHGDRLHVAFTLNLILAACLSVVGILAAPTIASFFHLGGHADLFRLGAINPTLAALGNIHDSLLLRDMLFKRRTRALVIRGVVRGLVAIALAVAGVGAASIVIGMLAGTLAWSATQWRLSSYRPRLRFDRKVARSMAAYGGGAASLEVLALLTTRTDVVIVGRVLGGAALGLYTVAYRLPEMLIESVAWNVSVVAFPAMARQRDADRARLGEATMQLLRWQALYAAPVAALLAVSGPAIIVVLFGPHWTGAAGVASALAVMFGISAVAFPLGDVYRALGRQRTLAAINLLQLALLVSTLLAVASSGILAVAWVRAAAQAIQALVLVGIACRMVSVRAGTAAKALMPAMAGAAGVTVGAGAVRVAWPALALGPLVAMIVAGLSLGVVAMRIAAPAAFAQLSERIRKSLPRRPGGTPGPVSPQTSP